MVLVTDNTNMVTAMQLGNLKYVQCFAHTINLIALRALKLLRVSRRLLFCQILVVTYYLATSDVRKYNVPSLCYCVLLTYCMGKTGKRKKCFRWSPVAKIVILYSILIFESIDKLSLQLNVAGSYCLLNFVI